MSRQFGIELIVLFRLCRFSFTIFAHISGACEHSPSHHARIQNYRMTWPEAETRAVYHV